RETGGVSRTSDLALASGPLLAAGLSLFARGPVPDVGSASGYPESAGATCRVPSVSPRQQCPADSGRGYACVESGILFEGHLCYGVGLIAGWATGLPWRPCSWALYRRRPSRAGTTVAGRITMAGHTP